MSHHGNDEMKPDLIERLRRATHGTGPDPTIDELMDLIDEAADALEQAQARDDANDEYQELEP